MLVIIQKNFLASSSQVLFLKCFVLQSGHLILIRMHLKWRSWWAAGRTRIVFPRRNFLTCISLSVSFFFGEYRLDCSHPVLVRKPTKCSFCEETEVISNFPRLILVAWYILPCSLRIFHLLLSKMIFSTITSQTATLAARWKDHSI